MALGAIDRLFADHASTPGLARRADAVLALWNRAAMGHAVLAGGCACGLPAMHVSVADFELDLLDYLRAKWAADPAAADMIDAADGKVRALINSLGQSEDGNGPSGAMLDDLETAIRSFAPDAGTPRAQRTG